MTIRNRLSLQFSAIVASILLLFSLIVYFVSATYRREEFYERLKSKARTTARLLIEVQEVDIHLLKIIDRNTLTALFNEKVLIFNPQNKLIYSSVDDLKIQYDPELLDQVRREKEIEAANGDNELVGLLFLYKEEPVVVLASAYDQFGKSKLQNLGITLAWGLVGGLVLTVGLGFFFAGRALEPVARINQQVQTITARNLRQRLDEGTRQDEIDQLAVNVNAVLNRLERAFEQQRSFVSHASHELRTPLAALKSEIQLGRIRPFSVDTYQEMLVSLEGDTDRLIALTNSLLFLARTLEQSNQFVFTPVRLDEVVFTAQEELVARHPEYRVDIRYDQVPLEGAELEVAGDEALLHRVVINLCDNACKYSPDHRAEVTLSAEDTGCRLTVRDQGIGIPPDEQAHVFEPFFRARQSRPYEGFGVGLAICQQIIALHGGTVRLTSEPGQGSHFSVWLPKQQGTSPEADHGRVGAEPGFPA